jgi:uncharacterized protein (DUF488 family)
MKPQIVTIGVYGFGSDEFFRALVDHNVDVFCDIRLRRGLRGSEYAFANSEQLQKKLGELNIRYIHCKDVAPSLDVRALQEQEDKRRKEARRKRQELGEAFKQAYTQERLVHLDSAQFLERVGKDSQVVALFCVEREPEACHRSLLAKKLAKDLGLQVTHIRPETQPSA